jgi:transposase-like protein
MSDRARYWAGLMEGWERSGLSQAEFCRRQGINGGTFAWWKRQLRDRASGGLTHRGRLGKASERFVEVRLASAAPAYEVVLSGGRTIRIGPQFDPEVLTRLIAAVESC